MNDWQTRNNESVLSHVMMPEGFSLSLGLKDYQQQKFLDSVLIGQPKERGVVTPRAHAYNNSFTELGLDWCDNSLTFQTALDHGELVILITPTKQPQRPSSLIVSGINL